MSLNSVTVTGQLPGAAGATAIFTRGGWLTDTVDDLLLPPVPDPVILDGNGKFSVSLLATDNAAPTPSGWTWTVNFVGVPGVAPYSFSFFLPFSGGATQDISSLAVVPAVTPMVQYLPIPTGTPQAGQVPAATGIGEASAWATLTAALVGAVPMGAAAVAPVAVPAVTETLVASVTVPAGLPAGATYKITAWGSISVGGTGGTFVSKLRVGGVAGAQVASASSGAFTASTSGFWVAEAVVTLQTPGASGVWSGLSKQLESVGGTNSNSMGAGTATASSLTSEQLALTIALSSATSTASCLGSVIEPRVA